MLFRPSQNDLKSKTPWPDVDFDQLDRLSRPVRSKFATVYDAARDPASSGRRRLLGHLVQHAYNPDRGYYTPHTADKYLKRKLPTYSKNVRDEVPFRTFLFTNPLAIPDGYGEPNFDMEASLKPSLRATNAGWLVTTIEYDPTTIHQFEGTAAWTCGKRDAPITLVDAELSKYADYRGYGAVFSGNKSVHYHFLWNTEHLVNAPFGLEASERLERMAEHAALVANAHEQYWNVVNDVVTRLLKPTLDPDNGLRSVTQYRRTPWGIRTLDKDSLLGIPAGTRVPQIVLAERIRSRAANESAGFRVPAEFSLSQPRRRRGGSSHCATATAGAEVLKLAREWLRQWWRADYPELAEMGTDGGEAVLRFRNHAGDVNPSTVARGDHKALLIQGSGHSLRGEPYFLPDDMTAQEFYEFVLLRSGQESPRPATGLEQPSGPVPGTFEFLKAQSQSSASPIDRVIRQPLERSFPEPFSDKPREELCGRYRAKLADRVGWIRCYCGNLEYSNDQARWRSTSSIICGGEGMAKTTAHVRLFYDEVRDQAYSWCSSEVFGAVAFRSRDQAQDKLHEFRELSPDKIMPVFIQPPGAYYESICAQLKLDPIRRTDLEDRTVHALYFAIREQQPTVYERLEEIRKAIWSESPFDGARTILTMSQRMAASWQGSTLTRAWHHPEFNPNETDEEVHRELANRFVLAKAIIDDGEIDEIVRLLDQESVNFVRDKQKEFSNWREMSLSQKRQAFAAIEKIPNWLGEMTLDGFEELMRLDLKGLTELSVDYNKIPWREHAGGKDIYLATHGAKLFMAPKPWLRGTKPQLTFLTTERLFSLVADKALREVGKPPLMVDFTHVPGVYPIEVPLWRDPRAAAYRSADDRRVSGLTQEILDADANAVVITDGIKNTLDAVYRDRVLTFQAAKGRNGLEANNIYVIVTCPAPAAFEKLNVLGQWLGRDDVIEMFYQDQIDQAVGRNRGFRHRGNSKSVVIMSPRTAALLVPKFNNIPGRTSLYLLGDTEPAPWLMR